MAIRYGTEGNDRLSDLVRILGIDRDLATSDTIYGLGGNDVITVNNGNDIVFAGAGNDWINDRGTGNDNIYAGLGNDMIVAGTGNNYYDGGADRDGVDFNTALNASVRVDLAAGRATAFNAAGGVVGTHTLVNIEDVYGSNGNDTIIGNAGSNALFGGFGHDALLGGDGRDSLYGGAGNDLLLGGRGRDLLWGGAGNDTFRFLQTVDSQLILNTTPVGFASGYDRITDFQRGVDRIDVSAIDADVTVAGNQAFRQVAGPRFTDEGQFRSSYNATTNVTSLHFNTDSNLATSEMVIELTGYVPVSPADILA